MKKAFISYNYMNREIVHNIRTILPPNVTEIIVHIDSIDKKILDSQIRNTIRDSEFVIFIIGNDNHNSPWIIREAEIAISMNKSIFCIRHPGTNGMPPEKLTKMKIVKWNLNEVKQMLDFTK